MTDDLTRKSAPAQPSFSDERSPSERTAQSPVGAPVASPMPAPFTSPGPSFQGALAWDAGETAPGVEHHIAMISDEPQESAPLAESLKRLGVINHHFSDIGRRFAELGNSTYGGVILDLKTTDVNGLRWDYAGLTLCTLIRRVFGNTHPIVFLTANQEPASVIACLRAGADAFLPLSQGVEETAGQLAETFRLLDWGPLQPAQRHDWADRLSAELEERGEQADLVRSFQQLFRQELAAA